MTTAAPRRTLREEVAGHLGLVLTSAGALLLVTRVYIASGRETGTALAMLRSAGLLPTALGVVTTLLPSLAVVAATGLALVALHDLRTGRRPARGTAAAVVAVLAAAFVPVDLGTLLRVLALLVLPAVAVLLGWGGARSATALWGAATAGLVGLHVLTSSALWLPAERVAVAGAGGEVVQYVGYALDGEGVGLRLLHHDPRLVLTLDEAAVRERVVCRLPDSTGDRDSVLSFLLARVDVGSPRSGAPAC